MSDTSKLERVFFNFLEVSRCPCFLERRRAFSPDICTADVNTGDAFCVQLLVKRGATEPSSINTVETKNKT